MKLSDVMQDATTKPVEKRRLLVAQLQAGTSSAQALFAEASQLGVKAQTLVLAALEEMTRLAPEHCDKGFIALALPYLSHKAPGLRREAARIIGNLAQHAPDDVEPCLPALLQLASSEGTVLRWAAAYALGRIVALPAYAHTPLYDTVRTLAQTENNSGVQKQYAAGLKRADQIKK